MTLTGSDMGKKWIPSLLWLCTTVLSRCDQTVSGDFILNKVEETTVKVPYLNFDLKFMLSLWNLQKKRFKSNWTCDTVWAALALFKRFHTKYAVITSKDKKSKWSKHNRNTQEAHLIKSRPIALPKSNILKTTVFTEEMAGNILTTLHAMLVMYFAF